MNLQTDRLFAFKLNVLFKFYLYIGKMYNLAVSLNSVQIFHHITKIRSQPT